MHSLAHGHQYSSSSLARVCEQRKHSQKVSGITGISSQHSAAQTLRNQDVESAGQEEQWKVAAVSRRGSIAHLATLLTATAVAAAGPGSAAETSSRSCKLPFLAALQVDYDEFASRYDELDDGSLSKALGFQDLRQRLLASASGEVLEVAVGTGLNLPLYNWPSITQLTAVDLSQGMLDQAAARVSSKLPGRPIQLQQANVEALPFPDASFDCVVDTFSLCVFPQPVLALQELARVLRRGGRLLLLEHSRSSNPLLAAYQDVTNSAVVHMSKGCAWNQDVEGMLAAAGLRAVQVRRAVAGTVVLLEAELA